MKAGKKEIKDKVEVTRQRARKNSKSLKVVELATEHPDLTTREIGKLADCSHVNVIKVLDRYGIKKQETEDYKTYRADILTGIQHRILKTVTDEDLKRMPIGQRLMGFGILYDKERLERGESTNNISVLVGAIKDIQRLRQGDDINDD